MADFNIPNNWSWCKLISIANIYTGNSINETEKIKKYVGLNGGYNYIATKDVGFNHQVNYKNGVKIPFNNKNFRIAYSGTPLMCIEGGSAGRKIAIITEDVCFGNKLCAFQCIGINSKYLYYYLQSPQFLSIFIENTTGIIGGVSVNSIKNLFFALPPLAEQERIVKEIEKYEPLIAEYDKLEQQLTKLDNEIKDKLKKSILQYAIQGKLVEQDTNDEPASVLLEKIRAEKKAQLGKKYVDSYIYKGDDNCYYEHSNGKDINITEEIPFELPRNWCWSRLKQIVSVISDGTHKTPNYKNEGIPFLSVQNISSGKLDLSKIKYISQNEHQQLIKRIKPQLNDILFCRIGTLGKAIKITWNFDFSIFVSLGLLRLINQQMNDYLIILINSPFGDKWIEDNKVGGGTHTFKINLESLPNMLVPIPPLTEQERIVNKINEIFSKL